ncbi:FCSD flavin-binding domain-containing protein [Thiomonas sp.]
MTFNTVTQPKSGHIANQEGKVCADAISRILIGQQPDPAPVTNSACFSTITMQQASWLTDVFQYNASSMAMQPSVAGESTGWSSDNFKDMETWYGSLMSDTFA